MHRRGEVVGTLSEINIYPLKSAKGVALQRSNVVATGFEHDRQWLVVNPDGLFLTQREEPRLCLISAQVDGDDLLLSAPDAGSVRVVVAGDAPSIQVRVWGDSVVASIVSVEADAWLTAYLGAPFRLVKMPQPSVRQVDLDYAEPGDTVGFADAFPFLLITSASLDDLNERLEARGEAALPMNRFRPNLVVDGTGPFAEDGWRKIAVGAVEFRVRKPCARCAITTVDQQAAVFGKEPLRTLATYRRVGGKVMFGQNLIHDGTGELRLGDEVRLIE